MKKIILFLMLGLFFISPISASIAHLGTFQKDTDITLLQICGEDCTQNNVTRVLYPNGSVAIGEKVMERDDTFYNLTFSNTSTIGTYTVNGFGDPAGVKTPWNYKFDVTFSGEEITTGNSIIVFLAVLFFFILGSLSLIGMARQEKKPLKWTLGLFGFIFFLTGLNLISVIISDALTNQKIVGFFDSFTAISFILFWFAFGLIAVIWILTTIQTLLFNKIQRNIQRFE